MLKPQLKSQSLVDLMRIETSDQQSHDESMDQFLTKGISSKFRFYNAI